MSTASQEQRLLAVLGRLNAATGASAPAANAGADLATLVAELEKAIDHAGDAVASVGSGESDTKRLQTVLARINASLGTKAASSPSELAGLVEAIEQAVGQAADSVGSKAAGHSSSKPETNVQTFSMAVAPQLAPVAPVAVEKSKETATVGNPADAAPTAAGAATPAAPNLDADVVKTPTVAAEAPDSAAVPATAAKSIYEGNLSKLGGGMFAKWQPRYFRLLQDRIEWSDSDKKPAKNHALLSEVKAIAQADEKKHNRKHVLEISAAKKTYYVQAADEASFKVWESQLTQWKSSS